MQALPFKEDLVPIINNRKSLVLRRQIFSRHSVDLFKQHETNAMFVWKDGNEFALDVVFSGC